VLYIAKPKLQLDNFMSEKITIVTGASRGIGQATALLLAKEGHKICVNYHHSVSKALETVSLIERAGGIAIAIQADVSDEKQVVAMFEKVDREFGPITSLVNNAGILMHQSTVETLTFDRLTHMFAINAIGSFLCCREAVKRMSTKNGGVGGSIVNVSSAASRLGSPNEYVDYAATKGAMDSLTRGLSIEVAGYGIRVNAVRPGFIHTDMHADGGEANRVERVSSTLPMKRGGNPSEVAEAISWLISDKSSYVTGTFIDLAGGK